MEDEAQRRIVLCIAKDLLVLGGKHGEDNHKEVSLSLQYDQLSIYPTLV